MSDTAKRRFNIRTLRERAGLTLNPSSEGPWLPYEETWHEMASAVLAMAEVVDAAHRVLAANNQTRRFTHEDVALIEALSRFDFGDDE